MIFIDKAEEWIWSKIPVQYKTPLSVIVLIIFIIAAFFLWYKSVIDNKEVKKYDPQIMYNSPGGFQIQGDINLGPTDRHLTDENITMFRNELAKEQFKKGDVVRVVSTGQDSEKVNLAYEIKNWLIKEGYKVEGIDFSFGTEYGGQQIKGILISKDTNQIIIGNK